jgi:hypothetical protein
MPGFLLRYLEFSSCGIALTPSLSLWEREGHGMPCPYAYLNIKCRGRPVCLPLACMCKQSAHQMRLYGLPLSLWERGRG